MRLALLLALQAAPDAPRSFDLRLLPKEGGSCGTAAAGGEIVVCARDDRTRYRLPALPPGPFIDTPLRAETGLAGGTIGIVVEQVGVGGVPSNRAMIRFKLKL